MCGTIGPAKCEGLSDRRVFSGSRAVGPTVITYSGKIVVGVYFDLKKAFDTIDHQILF